MMKNLKRSLKTLAVAAALGSAMIFSSCDELGIDCNCDSDAPYSAGGTCFETESACEDREGEGECDRCD